MRVEIEYRDVKSGMIIESDYGVYLVTSINKESSTITFFDSNHYDGQLWSKINLDETVNLLTGEDRNNAFKAIRKNVLDKYNDTKRDVEIINMVYNFINHGNELNGVSNDE